MKYDFIVNFERHKNGIKQRWELIKDAKKAN